MPATEPLPGPSPGAPAAPSPEARPGASPGAPAMRSALVAVLDATARSLRRLYGAASVSIALTSEDGSMLRFVVADGAAGEQVVGLEIPVTTGIAGWVATSQQQMAVADVSRDPRFARDLAERIGYVPTSMLAAPLAGEDGAVGVIEVLDPDPSRRGDLGTVSLVGSLLAALLSHVDGDGLDPALTSRVRRVGALGPGATSLANRLLDAVADAWDARD